MRKLALIWIALLAVSSLWASAPIIINRQITGVQPMTGLVMWNDNSEDLADTYGSCFGLEFTYCRPYDVVIGKSGDKIQYNWQSIENLLNAVAARGHQSILRFRYEYPNGEKINGIKGATAVPQYIKDLTGYSETYAKNPGGDGPTYYADWSNAELQWFTKQFYTDFAARYDNDPRIAFLEVGFGHWSEYHISGTKLKLGTNFPTKAYQSEFLQHIDTAFHVLPWMVSVDVSDEDYTPVVGNNTLMALHFGLFDDSFMHSEHDKSQGEGYNEECWEALNGITSRWKNAPCGGEISYYEDDDQLNFLNPAGMYGVTWEQASGKYHITFMICNDAIEGRYATPARFKAGSMACGYRFRLTMCAISGTSTQVTFTNEGIAPIYKDAYPAIGATRSATSLKGLLPGDSRTFTIPAVLTSADDLHIACDYLVSGQTIQFNADNVGVTTGIEQVIGRGGNHQKIMQNNRLVILHNGKRFSVLGEKL